MRVINWRNKICASLAAAGLIVPSAARAVDIPLGDPGFEAFSVPSYGYAYSNIYRPTSAWIDDQDHPSENRFEDDGDSNWLYNLAYGESNPPHVRPAPRTGGQAMHGLSNYSTQETSAVFEAGKTYTFSLYAQADENPENVGDHAWLYIYNGSVPFSEEASLRFAEFSPSAGNFVPRPVGATPALSQHLWQKISISHTVNAGAPEVGQPVGVGFFGRRDVAFDDASLSVDMTILTLEVNTANGHVRIVNETGQPVHFDYYEIESAGTSLNKMMWSSLQDQNLAGFPAGNGSGNGWEEAGGASSSVLSESFLDGSSQLAASANVALGSAFSVGSAQNLIFRYGNLAAASLNADFDNDGDVDGRDFLVWQRGSGTVGAGATKAAGNANTDRVINAADLAIWQAEYGNSASTLSSPGVLTTGFVRYVTSGFVTAVPEPTAVILVGLAFGALCVRRDSFR